MKFAAVAFINTFCLATLATKTTAEKGTSYENIIINNVKCALAEVFKIKEVDLKFEEDIQNCKGEVDEREKELLNDIGEIIKVENDISKIYEKGRKEGEHIGVVYKRKISVKIIQLIGKVTEACKMIDDITKDPGDMNECVMNAISSNGKYSTGFLANIEACTNGF